MRAEINMFRIFLITIFLGLGPLFAEPYMAVRSGLKCAVCHVNISGGAKRTDFGVQYSQFILGMFPVKATGSGEFFGGAISENVSVGANMRYDNTTQLAYIPSSQEYIDSLAVWDLNWADYKQHFEDSAGVQATNRTNMVEGDLYFQIDPYPGFMTFYFDHNLMSGGAPREMWTMFKFSYLNSYVKAGVMLLPYGLRLMDDDAFVRKFTGYTYGTTGTAIEAGLEPGPFSLIMNLTDTRFSTVGCVVFRKWRVGASFARATRDHGGFGPKFWGDDYLWGLFGGATFGRFTMLAEVDVISKEDPVLKAQTDRVAVLVENNFLIMKGLNFKTTLEEYDRNSTFLGNKNGVNIYRDGQFRFTVGLEAFVTPFASLSALYRLNQFVPDNVGENRDAVILRFHGFF